MGGQCKGLHISLHRSTERAAGVRVTILRLSRSGRGLFFQQISVRYYAVNQFSLCHEERRHVFHLVRCLFAQHVVRASWSYVLVVGCNGSFLTSFRWLLAVLDLVEGEQLANFFHLVGPLQRRAVNLFLVLCSNRVVYGEDGVGVSVQYKGNSQLCLHRWEGKGGGCRDGRCGYFSRRFCYFCLSGVHLGGRGCLVSVGGIQWGLFGGGRLCQATPVCDSRSVRVGFVRSVKQ